MRGDDLTAHAFGMVISSCDRRTQRVYRYHCLVKAKLFASSASEGCLIDEPMRSGLKQ